MLGKRPSNVFVAVQASWAVLKQNAIRSLMTLAVCSLGTAGVIIAGVMGQAQLAEMNLKMQALGGGLIVVSPNKIPAYPGRIRQLEHFISLVPEDGVALQDAIPELKQAVPVAARNATLRVEQTTSRIRLIGTSSSYFQLRGFQLAQGRFFFLGPENRDSALSSWETGSDVNSFPLVSRSVMSRNSTVSPMRSLEC